MNLTERLRTLIRLWRYRLRDESDSISFMRQQPLAGRTMIDVGANKGVYSYWMSRLAGPRGRVVAFEPQPDLRPKLDSLKQTFRLDNLEIIGKGLSSRPGSAEMRRMKPGDTSATIEPLAESDPRRQGESISVEIARLDEYCDEQGLRDVAFIKCDVEGHELSVFEGARGVLEKQRPVLVFECHHHEAESGELFAYLTGLGYEGFFMHGAERIPCARFAEFPYAKPRMRHRNYMFAHRDAPAR
jgi:FkbM family methyltransferase